MKKLILKSLAVLMLLLAPAWMAFGQAVEIPIPEDVTQVFDFLASYLTIAGLAMFLGEFVIRWLKATERWQKVVIVWILSIGCSLFSMAVSVGYLAGVIWWEAVIWGVLSGVAANGFFGGNIMFLKSIVEWAISYLKAKEPK